MSSAARPVSSTARPSWLSVTALPAVAEDQGEDRDHHRGVDRGALDRDAEELRPGERGDEEGDRQREVPARLEDLEEARRVLHRRRADAGLCRLEVDVHEERRVIQDRRMMAAIATAAYLTCRNSAMMKAARPSPAA